MELESLSSCQLLPLSLSFVMRFYGNVLIVQKKVFEWTIKDVELRPEEFL